MGSLSRELSITYANYKVGGDQANRILHDWHGVTNEFQRASVEYTFTIWHTSEAAFASEIAEAEAAFRKPRQDLEVKQGSKVLKNFSHSSSSGFNSQPQIVKSRDTYSSSGRHRTYTVRIEFGLPADNTGTSLRRDSFVNVAYSPSRRRTVTISGTYTANGSTSARGQYESAFAAYATSVLNDLTGTYKKLEEPQSSADDQNKVINFSVTYDEILFTGIGSGDASIRNEKLTITRNRTAPGDTPNGAVTVERLTTLTAVYEAWFDTTTNPQSALTKWNGTIRGGVITQIGNYLTGGAVAIVDESPDFDPANNKLTVRVVAQGSTTLGVIEYTQTVENDLNEGVQLDPAWTGDRFSKYRFDGPATWRRTVTQSYETFSSDAKFLGDVFVAPPAAPSVARINMHTAETPVRRGLAGNVFDTIRKQRRIVIEFYKPIALDGGGGTQSEPGGGGAPGGGGGGGGAPGGVGGALGGSLLLLGIGSTGQIFGSFPGGGSGGGQ